MDNRKALLISIFAVILLVVAIIATSYAAFTANLTGTKDNIINTGSVSLKCNETTFNIGDANPTSDARGIAAANNTATCDLISTMEGDMKVGYDVALTDVDALSPNDGLSKNNVKIQVYKSVDDGKTEFLAGTTATTGVLVSGLENTKGKYDSGVLSYNLDSATISGNHTIKYIVKAWVTNEKPNVSVTTANGVCSNTEYKTEEDCKKAGEIWGTSKTETKNGGTFSFKLKIGATQVLG